MDSTNHYTLLFSQLVAMLHYAALQQLGKLKNPLTDTVERQLDAAKATIDTLDMLRTKTAGNLSGEEERFLTQVIHELKLNYVDEVSKPEPPAQASGEEKRQ